MISRPSVIGQIYLWLRILLLPSIVCSCAPTVSPITPPESYKGPIAQQPVRLQGDYWVYQSGNLTRQKTTGLLGNIGFPLWIGKSWSYESEAILRGQPATTKANRTPTRIICTALGFKGIAVTAGTFDAFECECQCTVLSSSYDSSCGQWTLWYSPVVKNVVKLQTESTATSQELVEYKAARPTPSAKTAAEI